MAFAYIYFFVVPSFIHGIFSVSFYILFWRSAIVGTVLLGPVMGPFGTVMGGAAGGVAYRQLSKVKERKAQREWEQANFQRVAASRPGFKDSSFA